MIGFIAISGFILVSGFVFLALLIIQMFIHKVLYVKPILGALMYIIFGGICVSIAFLPSSDHLLSSMLISGLGMMIGLGWATEGMDRLDDLKREIK